MLPERLLIAYSSKPPIIECLQRAFGKKGIEAVGFLSDDNTWFDRWVIHAANKMGHNLRLIPKSRTFFSDHPLAHLHYRSRNLLRRSRELAPDLILIVRGIRFREDVLAEIRKRAVIFGWWIEREERMEEAFREARLYDHYFFMNSRCVDEARARGLSNVSLLHHAVDPTVFYPTGTGKRYDWCFVGNWSPKRQRLVEIALGVSENGIVYGRKWRSKNLLNFRLRRLVKGEYIEGPALARVYSESRIGLNITNWGFGEGQDRSGMNMRVLEIPACKTALLTDGSRDLQNMVTPNRHVIVYDNPEQFAQRLEYYLRNDTEREMIAREGFAHVSTRHTYDHVVGQVLKWYDAEKVRRA